MASKAAHISVTSEENFPQLSGSKLDTTCIPSHPAALNDQLELTLSSTVKTANSNFSPSKAYPSTLRDPLVTERTLFRACTGQLQTPAPDSTSIKLKTDSAMRSGTGSYQPLPGIDHSITYPTESAVSSGHTPLEARAASELCQVGEVDRPDDFVEPYAQNNHEASTREDECHLESLVSLSANAAGQNELDRLSQSECVAHTDKPVNRDQIDNSPLKIAADDLQQDNVGCVLDQFSTQRHEDTPITNDLLLLNVDGSEDDLSLDSYGNLSTSDDLGQELMCGGTAPVTTDIKTSIAIEDAPQLFNTATTTLETTSAICSGTRSNQEPPCTDRSSTAFTECAVASWQTPQGAKTHSELCQVGGHTNLDDSSQVFNLKIAAEDLQQDRISGSLDHSSPLEGHDNRPIPDHLPLNADDIGTVNHFSLDRNGVHAVDHLSLESLAKQIGSNMEPAKKIHFYLLYRRNRDDADGQLSLQLVKHLKELLEDKDRGRVGYYADCDAPIGSDILEEFFKAINLSRFIIVILSPKFVRGNWTNFLQKAAFRTWAESCDRNAFSRFLPIALGIDNKTVKEFCPHLCTKEVLYVPENFLEDQTWEDRLCKVHDLKYPIYTMPSECSDVKIAGPELVIPCVPPSLHTTVRSTGRVGHFKAPGEVPGNILQINPRCPSESTQNTKHTMHRDETVHKLSSDSQFHIERAGPKLCEEPPEEGDPCDSVTDRYAPGTSGYPTMSRNLSVGSQNLEAGKSASTITKEETGQQLLAYSAARSTLTNADLSKPIQETMTPSTDTMQIFRESLVSMHYQIDNIGHNLAMRMSCLEDEMRKIGDTLSVRVTDELNSLKDLVKKQDKQIIILQAEVLDRKLCSTNSPCNCSLVEKDDGTPTEQNIQRF